MKKVLDCKEHVYRFLAFNSICVFAYYLKQIPANIWTASPDN